MAKHKVVYLDVNAPDVQAQVEAQVPQVLELVSAKSDDWQERVRLVADADFIVAGYAPVPAELIAAAPKLKMIQKSGIGVDKIDVKAAAARGIPVAIAAGCNSIPVAEYAVMLMLTTYRRLPYVDSNFEKMGWEARKEMRAVCYQLNRKTVGIIGFGNIGRQVAKMVRGFDTRVIYYDKVRPAVEVEKQLAAEFRPLEALLAESDIITLHTPLTEETRNLINRERISLMKPTAIIINTARGELIDEEALVEALQSGRIMGAGIDVFHHEPISADHPLRWFKSVVATPHCAGSVIDNVANVFQHAFSNIVKFTNGEPLPPADLVLPE